MQWNENEKGIEWHENNDILFYILIDSINTMIQYINIYIYNKILVGRESLMDTQTSPRK